MTEQREQPPMRPPTTEELTDSLKTCINLVTWGKKGINARGNALNQETAELFISAGITGIRASLLNAGQHNILLDHKLRYEALALYTLYHEQTVEYRKRTELR